MRNNKIDNRISLESGSFGWDYIIRLNGTKRTQLIQTDWDYPGVASTFGWVACEDCGATDGTVDCAHRTAGEMIGAAADFLDSIADDSETTAEDPGYFSDNG